MNSDAPGIESHSGTRLAVVCTALPVEYHAVRAQLSGPITELQHAGGTIYETGTVFGRDGLPWTVVLLETGPGNTAAGVELERAIAHFGPQAALFVGVAGGRKDVSLGDVVVADPIYDYQEGKDTEHGYHRESRPTGRPTGSSNARSPWPVPASGAPGSLVHQPVLPR